MDMFYPDIFDHYADWPWIWIGWILHVLLFILVASHALRRRRESSSTILWIFTAWAVPLLGPILYLVAGVDRVPDKAFKKQITDQKLLAERKARENEELPLAYWRTVHESVASEPSGETAREFNRALDSLLPEHPLLGGNSIEPLVNGDEAFPQMLEAIKKARHHVHLQSFIISNDKLGREFLHVLKEKAKAGVAVRIMYDRFGSTFAVVSGLFRKYRGVRNMRIKGWTQANPLKRQFQVNLRNHRKLLVVDGNTAFCGGINISRLNITFRRKPPIQDYHFRISGPAVQELQYTFMRDWYFMTDENPEDLLKETYFPVIHPGGSALVRVINSGPTPSELETIADVFFMAINLAHKQILAVTPYFAPTQDIVRALRTAAFRGVDVRLVVPKKNNHFYAGLAGCALYDELLDAGVRIFERRPPFMHAKGLIVDDSIAVIGTANLDVRSLRLNYETDLAVYDNEFVNKLKGIVLNDISMSDEVNLLEWRNRPAYRRVAENLAYLMMPIL